MNKYAIELYFDLPKFVLVLSSNEKIDLAHVFACTVSVRTYVYVAKQNLVLRCQFLMRSKIIFLSIKKRVHNNGSISGNLPVLV